MALKESQPGQPLGLAQQDFLGIVTITTRQGVGLPPGMLPAIAERVYVELHNNEPIPSDFDPVTFVKDHLDLQVVFGYYYAPDKVTGTNSQLLGKHYDPVDTENAIKAAFVELQAQKEARQQAATPTQQPSGVLGEVFENPQTFLPVLRVPKARMEEIESVRVASEDERKSVLRKLEAEELALRPRAAFYSEETLTTIAKLESETPEESSEASRVTTMPSENTLPPSGTVFEAPAVGALDHAPIPDASGEDQKPEATGPILARTEAYLKAGGQVIAKLDPELVDFLLAAMPHIRDDELSPDQIEALQVVDRLLGGRESATQIAEDLGLPYTAELYSILDRARTILMRSLPSDQRDQYKNVKIRDPRKKK